MRASIPSNAPTPMSRSSAWPGGFQARADVEAFWERVSRGDDCLADIDPAELIASGVPASSVRSPNFVLRSGRIDGVDEFDHDFFGVSRREAAVMDPQHRQFIQCSWEALESAGHTPERFDGSIGVFGGSGMNTYLLHNLLSNPDLLEEMGWFLLRHTGNDKDFLTTTVSYRLGLCGPSVNVQTACSTSLVAVHLAAQSLLSFECDLALAGGVTIEFPHARGYEFREGEILSPTGRCRAFDASSNGTVLTGGVAVVALRRLSDALDDGDPILAVIKGSAVNNDGNRKVGYFAPSVDGHADVVKEALAVSGVDPRSIGLLEAHGTGTAVGDPIEVAALTEAFRSATDAVGFCRLGSDEGEHRPPRHGSGRRQPHQGGAVAAPPHAAAPGQSHRPEPAARPRAHPIRPVRHPCTVVWCGPAARRSELVGRGWHERARDRPGVTPAVADARRGRRPGARAVRRDQGGRRRGHRTARHLPRA